MKLNFSIIIPVFNGEKTIQRAIESIIKQNYQYYEIIIIDDGSTDNTSSIIKKYIEKNYPIKYILTTNKGVSNARNIGLSKATGEKILFLDADDFMENNLLSTLHNKLFNKGNKSVDFVFFGNSFVDFKGNVVRKTNLIDCSYDNFKKFRNQLTNFIINEYLNPPWNKVYSNEIIRKYNLKFEKNISIGEDLLFNLEYLMHTNSVLIISDCLINYTLPTSQGLTSRFRINRLKIRCNLLIKIKELMVTREIYCLEMENILKKIFLKDIWGYFMDLHKKECTLEFKEKINLIQKHTMNKEFLRHIKSLNNVEMSYLILKLLILIKNPYIIYVFSKMLSFKRLIK